MPDLKIEVIARNELGAIVALITAHGVVDAETASTQIIRGDVTYITGPNSFVHVPVRAISATGGAYLYANWDGSRRNNLHDLAAVRVRTRAATSPEDQRPSRRASAGTLLERLERRIRMLTPTRTSASAECGQA